MRKFARVVLIVSVLIVLCRFVALPKLFPRKYQQEVEFYAAQYQLEESFVYAVIFVESGFDETAVSAKDAKGLMQIGETTGAWAAEVLGIEGYTKEDLFVPSINIQIGCWYLERLEQQFGITETALAAYNAGSGNVSRWLEHREYSQDGKTLELIPYGETKRHVKKVMTVQKIYQWLYG